MIQQLQTKAVNINLAKTIHVTDDNQFTEKQKHETQLSAQLKKVECRP